MSIKKYLLFLIIDIYFKSLFFWINFLTQIDIKNLGKYQS